jgi:hypothetical protein
MRAWLETAATIQNEGQSRSRGSSIWLATSTSPYTRRSSSPLTIHEATGAGNEICVTVTQAGQPMDPHRFWDGVITSSSNLTRLRNEATTLRNRQEFSGASSPNLQPLTLSRGLKRATRLRRRSLTGMVDRLGFRRPGIWFVRWSQRLRCFRGVTLLMRAGLLIEG